MQTEYINGNFISTLVEESKFIRNRYSFRDEELKPEIPEYAIIKGDPKNLYKLKDIILNVNTSLVFEEYTEELKDLLLNRYGGILWSNNIILHFLNYSNFVKTITIIKNKILSDNRLILPYIGFIVNYEGSFNTYKRLIKTYESRHPYFIGNDLNDSIVNNYTNNINLEINLDTIDNNTLENLLDYQLLARSFSIILTGTKNLTHDTLKIIDLGIKKRKLVDIAILKIYTTYNIPGTIKFCEYNIKDWTIIVDLDSDIMYDSMGNTKPLGKISEFYKK